LVPSEYDLYVAANFDPDLLCSPRGTLPPRAFLNIHCKKPVIRDRFGS